MFKVEVDSLDAYFNFDPARKSDLLALDRTIRASAPNLERFFHPGAPPGEPGMRFKRIGYGRFHYPAKSGKAVAWSVIGVALQKNYISVYFAVTVGGRPIVDAYAGALGEWRSGINNFSFRSFADLRPAPLTALIAQAATIFEREPDNPVANMLGVENGASSPETFEVARDPL